MAQQIEEDKVEELHNLLSDISRYAETAVDYLYEDDLKAVCAEVRAISERIEEVKEALPQ